MKKEDIEFLKNLQHEMLTQDNVGQASPRFWVVAQEVKVYGTDSNFSCDGMEVVYEGETIGESLEDLYEYIKETEDYLDIRYEEYQDYIVIVDDEGNEDEIFSVDELVDYMYEELDFDESLLYIVNYRKEHRIIENTMFLTLEECKKHIECNKHHYSNAYPYAMTAWRSPQVARLYKILENTDWNNI